MAGSPPRAPQVTRMGGVVLAGGRSTRMGTPKATLEWHGSTLLYRTAAILARATAGPVVVVRADGQPLPTLPAGTTVVADPRPGMGPVQGIAAGLAALRARAGVEAAFVAATDMPFLHPAFIRRVLRELPPGGPDVALPVARGHHQPLAAAYRTALAETADRLVAEDRARPALLFQECAVQRLDEAALLTDPALAATDPGLDSLVNVNTPADYQAARARPAPEVIVRLLDTLGHAAGAARPHRIRAATLGAAAEAVGLLLDQDPTVAARLDDGPLTRDPMTPLADGDSVAFHSAAGVR
ncbi:MAG: molybdenum cofactor guanylyltransferase [Frankia sp.]|nr:molybdenum cofactor guanylyltransferase [Frankia sp.]